MYSSSSSLPPPRRPWKYDVFLSFRGEDTRNSFTDHLYAALIRKGIVAFRDEGIRGKPGAIGPELLKALEDSMFSIVVFSRNYASSGWCLDELAKIIECMDTKGQHVLPVFYDVDPSDVRRQKGHFEKDFAKHEENLGQNAEKVKKWREAMRAAANLPGWDIRDRSESEIINEIVEVIFARSNRTLWRAPEGLVGIDSHLVELQTLLDKGSDNVHIIGIYGIGGIGKTTIASVIFDSISNEFEASCFLANVREVSTKGDGLVLLQQQLLCDLLEEKNIRIWNTIEGIKIIRSRVRHKRVIVILDDVDELGQLKVLVGERHWFGPGSRIIITTRDRHLLENHGVDEFYNMEVLNYEESLQLFCTKAFTNEYPADGYLELSDKVVRYCAGLPLALQVLGSFFRCRSVTEWQGELERLKEIPNRLIMDSLRVSLDGLKETEQEIFLDIACFFNGKEENYITRILESCGYYPDIELRVLREKSLITIDENNCVSMHDLLQRMGREIVRQECPQEPGNRSRLWRYRDAYHVLENDTGTEKVQGIVLDSHQTTEASEQVEGMVLNIDSQEVHRSISSKSFLKMKKLKLLILRNLHCFQDLEFLSNELRYLEWNGYPYKSLPSSFHPHKLVELHLSNSNIEQLWEGNKRSLQLLKVINLSYSQKLIKTPNFNEVPNLKELILEGCTRLREVHQSIGVLEGLVLLNLKDCKSIKEIPSTIFDFKSLKNLMLHGCPAVHKFPKRLGDLTCSEVLDLGRDVANEQPPTRPWQILPWKDPNSIVSTLTKRGREILDQESPQEPGIWSRLKHRVLGKNMVGNPSTTPMASDELKKLNPILSNRSNGLVNGSVDGWQIGKLRVFLKEIAKGSNGTVVLEGSYDGRLVAVKRLVKTHHDVALKEIQNLIASDDHPNIVRYHGVESNQDFTYLALELCTGNLNDLIHAYSEPWQTQRLSKERDSSCLPEYTVQFQKMVERNRNVKLWKENGYPSVHLLNLMRDIVCGLAHLHQLDIVHRDLKPHNVLIAKDFCAKISDMGISKWLPEDKSSLTHATGYGTSGWLAPERLRNGRQTRAVDIFSLGCVLYFCITGGQHPFGEGYERDANIAHDRKDLSSVENMPEAVDLFSRLLDPNPDKRPKAQEVLNHPLFWTSKKRLSFLQEASDHFQGERKTNESDLLNALERGASVALDGKWNEKMEDEFVRHIVRRRKYEYGKVHDLVRVIRNQAHHYGELPEEIRKLLGSYPEEFDNYFSSRFPKLLIEVYKVVCEYCKKEKWFREYTE